MRLFLGAASAGLFLALPRVALAQDLAPPPPIDPNATPQQQATAENLEKGEKTDTGRGVFDFWLNAEAGVSYINMEQFSSSTFGLQKSSSGGAMFGLGAGVRILIFSLGVRARLHQLSVFNLWQVDGEAGLKLPAGNFEPYITAHAGYSFVGTLSADALSNPTLPGSSTPVSTSSDVSVHGVNAGLSVGCDYYFNRFVSIGIDATADALFLQRPPVPFPAGLTPAEQQTLLASSPEAKELYNQSGDSVGFGLAGSAHLGVHF